MSEQQPDRISVELTTTEAALVVDALRRYEPYWQPALDDTDRGAMLAEVRSAIDHVVSSLRAPV